MTHVPRPELIATLAHARAAQLHGEGVLCAPGIRDWCQRHHIDLRQFVEHGLPLAQFESIDDAFARRLIAVVRAESLAQDGVGAASDG